MTTPLDLETLDALFADAGPDMAPQILRVFIDDTAQQIDRALLAAEANDRAAIHVIAHSLKSSAATFGAPQVAAIARALEADAAPGETTPLFDKLLDLQCKFALTRQAMESKLEGLDSAHS